MTTTTIHRTWSKLLTLLVLGALPFVVRSSPTGASDCEGGRAAVGGAHVNADKVEQGTLNDGGIIFTIGGYELNNRTAVRLPIGQNLTWQLNATGTEFRGFLVRLEHRTNNVALDTTMAFQEPQHPRDGFQVAESACIDAFGVGGVTHTKNNKKQSVSGIFRMDDVVKELHFDITVVMKNRGNASVFYYSALVASMVKDAAIPVDETAPGNDAQDDVEIDLEPGPNGKPEIVVDAVNENEEEAPAVVNPGFFGNNGNAEASDAEDKNNATTGFFVDTQGD